MVIDSMRDKIGKEIEKDKIDKSDGIDVPKNNGKSRPIIIKFARDNNRCRIFKNKKNEGRKYKHNIKFCEKNIWKLIKIVVLRMRGLVRDRYFIRI